MSDFNLGTVTAYGYAKDKGYTGTEEEFAELMASYASVAESAAASATTATTKAGEASTSASNAATSATTASTAATTATTKAGEASTSASTASTKASEATTAAATATTKAGEASTSATNAAESATTASTAATTATTKASEAAASATAAAASAASLVIDDTLTHAGQAADAKKTGDEITSLKEDLSSIEDFMPKDYIRLNVTKEGGYVTPSLQVNPSQYWQHITVNVKAGEKYKIVCGAPASDTHAKMLIAGNGLVIQQDATTQYGTEITIPSGADTLYLNGQIGDGNYSPTAFKYSPDAFDDAVENIVNDTYAQTKYEDLELDPSDGNIRYNIPNTEQNNGNANYEYVKIPVVAGENYKVTAKGGYYTIALYDNNNALCTVVVASTVEANEQEVTIPLCAYYMVVNTVKSYGMAVQKKVHYISGDSGTTVVNQFSQDININGEKPTLDQIRWNYLFHDNFHRDDSASSIGHNGDSVIPMNWTVISPDTANIGISNNSAYRVSGNTAIAYADVGVSDCTIDVKSVVDADDNSMMGCGIAFRIADAQNFWTLSQFKNGMYLRKFENGSATRPVYVYTVNNDGIEKVSVTLKGDNIAIYINGIKFDEINDSFNSSETKHGICFCGGSNSKVKYFDIRIPENWQNGVDVLDAEVFPFYIKSENKGEAHSFYFEQTDVNDSNSAMQFSVKKTDNTKRSELSFRYVKQLSEEFVSLDVKLGNDYSVVDNDEIIFQFHDSPEDGSSTSDNAKLMPNVAMYLDQGHYKFRQQYSSVKPATKSDVTEIVTDLGSYLEDVGNWVRWSMRIKWGYETFFEPFIYLYKDGELVYKSLMPNTVNASKGSYFKCGVYTYGYVDNPSDYVSTSRSMLIDNTVNI